MSERLMTAEALARRFHELYEALAPNFGYETRRESAVPWAQAPERNRSLMIAVADVLLDELAASGAAEFCGDPYAHSRHEWFDGVLRKDCSGSWMPSPASGERDE